MKNGGFGRSKFEITDDEEDTGRVICSPVRSPATTKSKGNAMENVSLPEDVSAKERAQLMAVAVALATIMTPLCKAIVDEYLSNLNVSVNPKQ